MSNIAEQFRDGRMQAIPMTYRVDFSNKSIDRIIDLTERKTLNV